MKPLRYLFYRLYQLMISVGNENDAAFTTVLVMGMLVGLNITCISAYIYIFNGLKIDMLFGSKFIVFVEYLLLCLAFYLLFVNKNKHLEIAKHYEGESSGDKMNGKVFAIGYLIVSIGSVFFSFYLMILKNRGD